MNIRLPARIGAFACLGVALAMSLLALRDEPKPASPPAPLSTDLPTDPLQAALRSCQLAGQAAGSDPGCLAAWAENRRRFLGAAPPEPVADDAPGKSSDAMEIPTGAISNDRQEQ
ncbi:conjugal transfer protein TrbK [Sphingomonas spermidinifaciens]|uniref:Conjugal transfer protein TrbK n=1 Tax=Sphingomonas spermidinifaciens TaxID=1141889 RepID=A0A2A4B3D0_9SPHN|nr:putative entry exclusion protein TrbK-alt [Sphingomonas spermidinifaciens]PCD02238.1 conjugal transfer protein TrbK [Sphingomonas spermidinifaciens]